MFILKRSFYLLLLWTLPLFSQRTGSANGLAERELDTLLQIPVSMDAARDITVPVELRISLFKEVPTFDRNLEKRCGGGIFYGVLFQGPFRRPLSVKNKFFSCPEKMPGDALGRRSVKFEAIDLNETSSGQAEAAARNINVLYPASLRATDVNGMIHESQSRRWVTWTGVLAYVDAGCSFGIVLKSDRPSVKINLLASLSEGMDFSSQLPKPA